MAKLAYKRGVYNFGRLAGTLMPVYGDIVGSDGNFSSFDKYK